MMQDFLLLVFVAHDFQEQHPSQLLDALAPDSYRGPERPRSSRMMSRMDLMREEGLGIYLYFSLTNF